MTALALVISVALAFISGWVLAYAYGMIKLNRERREWIGYLRKLTADLDHIEEAWKKSIACLQAVADPVCLGVLDEKETGNEDVQADSY